MSEGSCHIAIFMVLIRLNGFAERIDCGNCGETSLVCVSARNLRHF